ncbi:MFS transporter [Amycolatopsis taiwanensis]|uniref:MFS transporter n=1 Tax=Amycolatopsis taiwanensis TaxID=342230 RepID=A0A9W6VJK1_9PSEU|nr:aromatic acid/H+ symport family MFS transporter [Amycolatopsis taiwanensis]GLY69532.1 MFS transporter [Amycolatopsis taiwanensis]
MTRTFWPIILCWLTVLIEGYDLVALGVTIPTVLNDGELGFTPAAATAVATISLVGVAIGASGTGPIADRFGRRGVLVASVLLFSVFTVIVPLSPNPLIFGIFRLIAGVGLGACMPTALAVMSETLPARHRASSSTITMTGYHVGAVATSVLALAFGTNWDALYYVGGVVGLVLAGVIWLRLPESAAFLAAKANVQAERRSPRDVLTPRYRRISIAVWVGSFMGLLLVYGLNTWLPQLMRTAGYAMSTSVTLLLVLNTGAIIGLLVAGFVADRRGIKPTVLAWFGIAAVFLALLSMKISSSLLLNLVVLATGIFVFSSQVLIFGYVAHTFPPQVRGTALGLTSGIGRLGAIVGPFVTGALVTAGIAYPWGFWLFAVVAVLGLGAMLVVPRTPATDSEPEVTAVPGT